MAILQQKAKRIEKRKLAVEQYQIFLERVREKNSDEYAEISDILARYTTLTKANNNLKADLEERERMLADMKSNVVKYEKDMNTEIMKLNNNIAKLNTEFEKIDIKKQKIKTDEEENSSKQLFKITQLSRILMAINNLEQFCHERKDKDGKTSNQLNYDTQLLYPEHKDLECVHNKHFNNYNERKIFAMDQLVIIGQYLNDFGAILQKFPELKDQKDK